MITKTVTNYKNDTEFSLLYIDNIACVCLKE